MNIYQRYDDTELFQLIAAGDVEAYREIFGKYFPKVYEAALAYPKVPEQAEDIVQGVFLKLWEKREQLALIKSPSKIFNDRVNSYSTLVASLAAGFLPCT